MEAYERLLRYVRVWTTSDESSTATPSTERQSDLAWMLEAEMKEMGIADARMDEHCYVYGTIPATPGYEDRPRIGFIAHLDTAPDFSGEGVKPQLHENYDGGVLPVGCGNVLDPELFPHLKGLKGHTLITTDGSTLLGADDKAGIAEILTMAEHLLKTDIPHGQVSLAFTPDEEIGSGAHLLDIPAFGAEYAYTVDGGQPGEINYETFNAAAAEFEVRGVSVHPGSAKGVMVNAALLAMEINSMLPSAEIPAKTEHYEGFFHLCSVEGNVEKAALKYIVRDHSASHFEARLECLQLIEKTLNEKYGPGTVSLRVRRQYRNMEEKIRPCMHLVDTAKKVMEKLGVTPDTEPVRGGTDGSELSFRGLPCPNLGTGGYCFHGPLEHISVENTDLCVKILLGIVEEYAQHG